MDRIADHDSPFGPAELGAILLAGQGARILGVREMIARRFEGLPVVADFQENAVIRGLAVQAGILQGERRDVLLLDVLYRTLGLRCSKVETEKTGETNAVTGKPAVKDVAVVTGAEADEASIFELVRSGTIAPFRREATVQLESLRPEGVLRLVEQDDSRDGLWIDIGHVSLPLVASGDRIQILTEADADRTILLIFRSQEGEELGRYQLNHPFKLNAPMLEPPEASFAAGGSPRRGGGHFSLTNASKASKAKAWAVTDSRMSQKVR